MTKHLILHSKVAVITGAAQGLGEATARLLAQRGAAVILTDRNEEAGRAVTASIKGDGLNSIFIPHDVTSEENWEKVVRNASEQFGKVDILVNNAAVFEFGPINELTLEQFSNVLDVNVKGVFLGCKMILPMMQVAEGGSIINISSVAGMIANTPGAGAYAASKGAVRLLTKSVALDYAPYNIRVNSVHPGGIATPVAVPLLNNPDTVGLVVGRALNNRAAQPKEIASVIAFLASDESSYINGSEIVADGGWLAH